MYRDIKSTAVVLVFGSILVLLTSYGIYGIEGDRPPEAVRQVVTQPASPLQMASITVDADRVISAVPRRLFGTNLRQNMQSSESVISFIKKIGITLFRYPDSIDSGYSWDWNAGGTMTKQGKPLTSQLARFEGALALGAGVKADLFYTMKIYETTPEEAARWVTEAKRRGAGGSYWCLGNEPYFKGTAHYITREKYVDIVRRLAPAMKAADPTIRIGIAWGGPYIEENLDKGRDSYILRHTKEYVDFIDFHFYTGRWEHKSGIDANRIMAGSLLVREHVKRFRAIFKREAAEKADKIEIQYWEWNGPCWPGPEGMHTVATALFAADALGEFAENGLTAAMQYNLQERNCGLIPGWEKEGPDFWASRPWDGKTIRPIAYALQLWSKEMGSSLVTTTVKGSGSYQTTDWHTWVNYQGEVPMIAAHATTSADKKNLQLLVVNRNDKEMTVAIKLMGFMPTPESEVLSLGENPAWSKSDLQSVPSGKLTRGTWGGAAAKFSYTFPARSVTVLKMRSGTGQ